MKMKILIDNGHGVDTPGKRSPDGRFREYAYTRLIASGVCQHLIYRGFDAQLLVPEPYDVCLPDRVDRVNACCRELGRENVILLSIHVNAAGMGDIWKTARGWAAYTSKGKTPADELAAYLYDAARLHLPGHRIRTDYSDEDPDWEEDFFMLRRTLCPSVVTENLFQDCRPDVEFLESDEGRRAIVALHVEGIVNFLKSISP